MSGVPVVGTLEEALTLGPTTAIVGVATQGGRFPPAWRALLRRCIEAGLDIESGLHEFLADDTELSELAREHGVAPATCDARRATSTSRWGEPPRRREDRAHSRVGLRHRQEDGCRRARPGSTEPWPCVRLLPDRPDGHRDRGLGHRGRRRRRRLPRRRRRARCRGGGRPRRQAAVRRRPGSLVHPLYSASRSASCTGLRRTRSSSATMRGRPRSKAARGT